MQYRGNSLSFFQYELIADFEQQKEATEGKGQVRRATPNAIQKES